MGRHSVFLRAVRAADSASVISDFVRQNFPVIALADFPATALADSVPTRALGRTDKCALRLIILGRRAHTARLACGGSNLSGRR
jgi:hypothetical protein